MENDNYVIERRNISKSFPGIKANDNITLQLKKGEIHALLGENGAGKSTLRSILFGLYQPDEGEILKDGKPVRIQDPNDATKLGIGRVHQHFKLVECFTVLDNIILGAEDTHAGFVTKKKAIKKITALRERYGLKVDLNAKIRDISVGRQQRTEILKRLYRDNDILIFDEPTAVLTPHEIEDLRKTRRFRAKEGKSILFISHKLNEIRAVSDRCTILRKGKRIKTLNTKETNTEELASLMVGRHVSFNVDKARAKPGKTILKINNLTRKSQRVHNKESVKDVSFEVHEGEIATIAGIEGNGQTDLVNGITGLGKVHSGKIIMNGNDITNGPIRNRIKDGRSHIPEDRQKYGLVLDFSLEENRVLERYKEKEFSKKGWIEFKNRKKYSDKVLDAYDVRSSQGGKTIARSRSGGNQQKAIVGRELDKEHSLLVAVQPTRGLDVGAIESIHKRIVEDRDKGNGVLLVSLELDEVRNLSDIIYVRYEGEIVGAFLPKETTAEEMGLYRAGAKRRSQEERDKVIAKEENKHE